MNTEFHNYVPIAPLANGEVWNPEVVALIPMAWLLE